MSAAARKSIDLSACGPAALPGGCQVRVEARGRVVVHAGAKFTFWLARHGREGAVVRMFRVQWETGWTGPQHRTCPAAADAVVIRSRPDARSIDGALTERLGRALSLPDRRERARRYLESPVTEIAVAPARPPAGEPPARLPAPPSPPIAGAAATEPDADPPPVLPYARGDGPSVLVTRGGGILTIAALPEPPLAAWARGLRRTSPVVVVALLALLGLDGIRRGFAPVTGLAAEIGLIAWAAAVAFHCVGRRTVVTVTPDRVTLHTEARWRGLPPREWPADDFGPAAARRDGGVDAPGLAILIPPRAGMDAAHVAAVLNAALGIEPLA